MYYIAVLLCIVRYVCSVSSAVYRNLGGGGGGGGVNLGYGKIGGGGGGKLNSAAS